jgi:heme-degrading monooxygenase HmoA
MTVIVFRNRLKPGIEEEYGAHASAVYELAERMPGFVASKDFVADDEERLTVIEFSGSAELAAWRNQPQHREAQEEGRRRYYTQYSLQVCELVRESRWVDADGASPTGSASKAPHSALEPYEGGCFCGNVRYRAVGRPKDSSICHCSICRRTSGAPMVGWTTFETSELSWLKAEPRRFSSSDKADRSFCSECGTALTFVLKHRPERTDVTLASLDHPERLAPLDHIHTSSRIPWVRLADGVPTFPGERGGETP